MGRRRARLCCAESTDGTRPLAGARVGTSADGLRFDGVSLQLNVEVAAMGELQDEGGTAIEGYGLDDCGRVLFNDVACTVTWRGRGDLSPSVGGPCACASSCARPKSEGART